MNKSPRWIQPLICGLQGRYFNHWALKTTDTKFKMPFCEASSWKKSISLDAVRYLILKWFCSIKNEMKG